MTDEMKPVRCGCGGEAAVLTGYYEKQVYFIVKCWECGTQTCHKRTKAEAISAWNKAMGAKDINVPTKVKVNRLSFGGSMLFDCDGECECGKMVDALWDYCPSCGAKLYWGKE